MFELIKSTNSILLGGVALIAIIGLIGALTIRSGSRSKYFRLKRKRVELGWKWIFVSIGLTLVFAGLFFFKPEWLAMPTVQVSTPVPTQPSAHVEQVSTPTEASTSAAVPQPSATQTSTKAAQLSETPAPTETISPTGTSVGPATSTMRPTLTASLTNTLAPTFTPVVPLTAEPTWTQQVFTPTVTNTRAPTATEPAP